MSVYTPVSATELATFLHEYAVGALIDHAGIRAGVENSNFFVTTTQGAFVLTLFEHHRPTELDYFLDLMQHWADAGMPVPRPVHNRAGQLLSTLNGKPAALVMRLAGQHIEHPTLAHCAALGTALAKLHLRGQAFPRQRAPDRGHTWRMQTAERLLPHLNLADANLLQTEVAFQQRIPFSELPSGTIHADLFRDNVLFDDDGHLSGILDIYFACHDNWLYDLAIVVNDWCCEADGALNTARVQACLAAYQALRPWNALEHRYWFACLRAAALRFWLSRLDAQYNPRSGDNVLQKDPAEFRCKLLQRINEANVTVDARGLLCPLPVIRVQTAVENLPVGVCLTAICSDPGALHDVPAWARLHGHTVLETRQVARDHFIVLQTGQTP